MSPSATDLPSKGAVDRAGRRLANALIEPGAKVAGADALEFWADRFASPAEFERAADLVRTWRRAHAYPLRKTSANLRHYIRDIPDAQVAQRLKKFATVVDKLGRFDQMKLSRMEDIGGCRVVVPDMVEVRDLARRLKKNWIIKRDRDYVVTPKPDGYRARHLVTVKDGRFIEVQVRTKLQDLWANTVERDGRSSGVGLKFGEGDDDVRESYKLMSDLMAAEERGEPLPNDIVDVLLKRFDPAQDGR